MEIVRFIVWGAGGHAAVVADTILQIGHEVVGFVETDLGRIGAPVPGFKTPILLHDPDLRALLREKRPLPLNATAIALGFGSNSDRHELLTMISDDFLPRLVHPSAIISTRVTIDAGVWIGPRVVINARAHIGRGAIINSGAIVEHDCRVGVAAHVSPGAVLAGGCHIGDEAWVGAGAIVLPGIRVGAGAVVGAGGVVTSRVADRMVVMGVPARPQQPK